MCCLPHGINRSLKPQSCIKNHLLSLLFHHLVNMNWIIFQIFVTPNCKVMSRAGSSAHMFEKSTFFSIVNFLPLIKSFDSECVRTTLPNWLLRKEKTRQAIGTFCISRIFQPPKIVYQSFWNHRRTTLLSLYS